MANIFSGKSTKKAAKYAIGDCISIHLDGMFLGALISNIYTRYYDITLINYYAQAPPVLVDFLTGQFFGTRFGSWEDLTYAVNVRMIARRYIDAEMSIEKIGSVEIIKNLTNDGYAYLDNIQGLLAHFKDELPIRIQKTANAEKFPDLAFVSMHLIEMKYIIE